MLLHLGLRPSDVILRTIATLRTSCYICAFNKDTMHSLVLLALTDDTMSIEIKTGNIG